MDMKQLFKMFAIVALACGCSCSGSESPAGGNSGKTNTEEVTPSETTYDAYAYVTKADKTKLFSREGLELGSASSMSPYVVKFTSDTYQSVDGFGAAITVSTCYLLSKMAQSDRTAFLKQVFDPDSGLGSSLIRISIGGCDFSWDYGDSGISSDGRYTWCEEKGISNFAAHPMDVKYLIPILKEIYAINPNVKIIGSPWTAPRWMKLDSNLSNSYYSWTGGRLDPECYEDYSTYFVKWIQYMESQGFDIYAITPENEPLNAGNSMSMLMYWQDCRDFVKVLGPALQKAGLDTKILIFDHNYNYDNNGDQKSYPLNVYNDSEASKYVAGSAWHNYGGSVSELDNILAAAPDKEIYFTEASIGTWNYSFDGCLINDFRDIFMGTLSRNGKGVTLWNLMLDDKKGPYTNASGSCTTCYGAVTIMSSDNKTIEPYSQYYNIAHCSKVIKPGAVRIGTSGYTTSGISYQAYKNTDGSYGVIILNENSSDQQLVFCSANHSVKYTVPSKSIVSLIWND